MTSLKTWRRFATALAVLSIAIAAGLVGGASTGQAATGFTVNLSPLIGSNTNEIPQVTFGGKIGYHLFVENTGDSTTTQVQIRITSDSATFFDTSNPNCQVNPKNSKELVCTPPGGTLSPNDTFDVDARFTAPSSGVQVSTKAALVVAAQSVGGSKNKGTVLKESDPVLTNLTAGGDKEDTFLRKTESAETGNLSVDHQQKFGVSLPATLLGDPFGVALSIHDQLGTLCDTCLPTYTTLSIPAASSLSTLGNPFYNGTDPNQPYPWSMSAKYPPGFKLTGILHVDDALVPHQLPTCESLGGAPTATEPLCYLADSLVMNKGSKTVEGNGLGLENGNFGFN